MKLFSTLVLASFLLPMALQGAEPSALDQLRGAAPVPQTSAPEVSAVIAVNGKVVTKASPAEDLRIEFRYVDDGGPYGRRKKRDFRIVVEKGGILEMSLGKSPLAAPLTDAQIAELQAKAAAVLAADPNSLVARHSLMLRGIHSTFEVGDGTRNQRFGLTSSDDMTGALAELYVSLSRIDEQALRSQKGFLQGLRRAVTNVLLGR